MNGPQYTSYSRICVLCRTEYPPHLDRCRTDGGVLIQVQNNPLIGTLFADRYEILSVGGFGAMSVVFRVKHVSLPQTFALKVLHRHLISEPQVVRRFRQEAHASSSLHHPNVTTVYEAGIFNGMAYLVMDYVDGWTLEQVLEQEDHLDVRRAVCVFAQVSDGLHHAHQQGILHRDLKLSNIMLSVKADGAELATLLDFGLAKLLYMDKNAPQLTREGEVCGTPIVMSPEQCLGRTLDARSDIYSLGCLMYGTISGVLPLIGDSIVQTMTKHVSEKPQQFSEVAPNIKVHPAVQAVVFRCLEKDPNKRFQSAGEVRDALLALLGSN